MPRWEGLPAFPPPRTPGPATLSASPFPLAPPPPRRKAPRACLPAATAPGREGSVPERQGNAHLQIVPYQLCATADGWLVLAVGNDRQWQHFCEAAGQPELSADPRFVTNPLRVQNRAILVPLVEELMRTHSTAE